MVTIVGDDNEKLEVTKDSPMPFSKPLVAHGDLTVEKPVKEEKSDELPPVGTKFMVSGKEYQVSYINEGKKRFTSVPCSGQY